MICWGANRVILRPRLQPVHRIAAQTRTIAGIQVGVNDHVRWRIGTNTATQYTGAFVGFFQACIVLR